MSKQAKIRQLKSELAKAICEAEFSPEHVGILKKHMMSGFQFQGYKNLSLDALITGYVHYYGEDKLVEIMQTILEENLNLHLTIVKQFDKIDLSNQQ